MESNGRFLPERDKKFPGVGFETGGADLGFRAGDRTSLLARRVRTLFCERNAPSAFIRAARQKSVSKAAEVPAAIVTVRIFPFARTVTVLSESL